MRWRYHYIPAAVSDHNGYQTFHRNADDIEGALNEEWGFSMVSMSFKDSNEQEVEVDIIDFAAWLERNVVEREIPLNNTYNHGHPLVMMKMDIEGYEFAVLEHLLDTGAAHKINIIVGEWHPGFVPQVIKGRNYTHPEQLQELSKNITDRLNADNGPGFFAFDDEEYLRDGMEYPVPPKA
jgi:hypothetical protein